MIASHFGRRIGRHAGQLLFLVGLSIGLAACSGPASPPDEKARLEKDTGVAWAIDHPSPFVTHLHPRQKPQPSLANGKSPEAAAREFFKNYSALFGMKSVDAELAFDGVTGPDRLGVTHAIFHQHAGDATVEGARLGVHFDAKGRISWVGTLYVPNLDSLDTTPALDGPAALSRAQADMITRFPPGSLGAPEKTAPSVLTIIPSTSPSLSYRMTVSFIVPEKFTVPIPPSLPVSPLRKVMRYLIDAKTGAILEAHSGIVSEDTATGRGVLYYQKGNMADTKQFLVLKEMASGHWRMIHDATDVTTRLFARPAGAPIIVSTSLDPFDSIAPNPGSHVDAYYNFGLIDQYWRTQNRKSWDNAGAALRLIMNDPDPEVPNNAWWDAIDAFHFSAANPAGRIFAQALDVCGHEFQHAVNQAELHLDYSSQPGALNESLADNFGQFIEHTYRPDAVNNLTIGETQPPLLRDLGDPTATGQPDHMDTFKSIGGAAPSSANDYGWVHANTGIPNKAWTLITVGGTHAHSMVTTSGIGWAPAEALYYSTLIAQPPVTLFADFAEAMAEEADSIDDNGATLQTVACAWFAVGVFTADSLRASYPDIDCGNGQDGGAMNMAPPDLAMDASTDMSMDASTDMSMDAGMDGATDMSTSDAAADMSKSDAAGDMAACAFAASDFEGMQVKLTGITNEFADSTMTLTGVKLIGLPKQYVGSFGGPEAGNPTLLSMDVPPTATVFTFGDNNQTAGVVGFPAVFNNKNFANRNGRSNLIAIWQDGMGSWQWAWNVSGGSYNNNGGFPQWHEYQFVYDSRKAAMGRTRYDVFLGGNAMPIGWSYIRTAPAVMSVTFAKNPPCALPGQ